MVPLAHWNPFKKKLVSQSPRPVATTTNPDSFEGVAKKAEDGNPKKREGDQGGDDERDDGGDEIDCHCVVVHILGFMGCEQTTS